MVDLSLSDVSVHQSLINQWLVSHFDEIDLLKACRTSDRDTVRFVKKSYLELSGYALVTSKFGLPVAPEIDGFLKASDRVELLFALAAREPSFFSQYGMALGYLAQDADYRDVVRDFVAHLPVFRAADPSESAPQKMLDRLYVLHVIGLEAPVRLHDYAGALLNAWGDVFHLGEQHIYFLTHLIFFLNGFGADDWPWPIVQADPALLDKAALACLGRNNLDGALETVIARLVGGQSLQQADESILLTAFAKLQTYGQLDPYVWSEGQASLRTRFHPMIVTAILCSVLRGKQVELALNYAELDHQGLRAGAVLAGLTEALGQHDFSKIEAAERFLDCDALKAFISEETRASIHRDFQALQQLLQLGDGQGFGFFLPEQQSGIEINHDQRQYVARWFASERFHALV